MSLGGEPAGLVRHVDRRFGILVGRQDGESTPNLAGPGRPDRGVEARGLVRRATPAITLATASIRSAPAATRSNAAADAQHRRGIRPVDRAVGRPHDAPEPGPRFREDGADRASARRGLRGGAVGLVIVASPQPVVPDR